jgi:glutathione S-transferase
MITLHRFGPGFGLPSPSPFCMKLECFLVMAGLPYRSVPVDLATAPKGKAPWIEDDGARVGDSALGVLHLERKHGLDLEQGLSPADRAAAHGFGVMLEERTYFVMVRDRWLDDANWPIVRDAFLGDLPPLVQDQIRQKQREKILAQGLGAHSPEEMHELAVADVDALADWLDAKPFFMGAEPTKIDATVHAFVCNFLGGPFATPLKAATARHANLVAYNARMLARFFPSWAACAA